MEENARWRHLYDASGHFLWKETKKQPFHDCIFMHIIFASEPEKNTKIERCIF